MESIACIIPTHNRPQGLRKALHSVLQQTRPADEIIVVDDVASPETQALISDFRSDVPIRLCQPDIPVGRRSAGTSRNFGAQLASSDYLAFLDDDDYWHSDFLESLVSAADTEGTELVCCWISLRRQGVEVRVRRPSSGLRAEEVITKNPGFTGSNFIVSRTAFESIGGFDPDLPVSNDIDLLVRLLRAGVAYSVVPVPLAHQTTDGRDHLSARGLKRANAIRKYQEKHRQYLSRQDLRRLRRNRYVAMRFPEQNPVLRGVYFALTVLTSDLGDWAMKSRKVVKRLPSEYA